MPAHLATKRSIGAAQCWAFAMWLILYYGLHSKRGRAGPASFPSPEVRAAVVPKWYTGYYGQHSTDDRSYRIASPILAVKALQPPDWPGSAQLHLRPMQVEVAHWEVVVLPELDWLMLYYLLLLVLLT